MRKVAGRSIRASYWLAGCSLLLLMMGTNVPSPLYGLYQERWGFSSATLTLIFAGYVAALIPSLLIFGRLSDAFGRRRVALAGLCVAVLGAVLFPLAHGVGLLFAARALQGVAVGITTGALTAALTELHPHGDRRAAALVATTAVTVGGGLGPLFGGVLAEYASGRLIVPYLAYLLLFVPAVVALWAVMAETVDVREAGYSSWRPQRPGVPAGIRRFFGIGATACFLGWALGGFFIALVSSYAASQLGMDNLALSGGAVFLMFGCASVAQVWLRSLSFHQAMMLGSVAAIGGLLALVFAVPTDSVWLFLVGATLNGFSLGLTFMGGMGLVGQVAPAQSRAEVISSCYVAVYLGVGLPTVAVGFAADAVGLFPSVIGFAAVMAMLGLFVCLSASRIGKVRYDHAGDYERNFPKEAQRHEG